MINSRSSSQYCVSNLFLCGAGGTLLCLAVLGGAFFFFRGGDGVIQVNITTTPDTSKTTIT